MAELTEKYTGPRWFNLSKDFKHLPNDIVSKPWLWCWNVEVSAGRLGEYIRGYPVNSWKFDRFGRFRPIDNWHALCLWPRTIWRPVTRDTWHVTDEQLEMTNLTSRLVLPRLVTIWFSVAISSGRYCNSSHYVEKFKYNVISPFSCFVIAVV